MKVIGVVGHPEPQHRLAALGLVRRDLLVGQVAAVAVVPGGAALGAGLLVAGSSSSSVEQ